MWNLVCISFCLLPLVVFLGTSEKGEGMLHLLFPLSFGKEGEGVPGLPGLKAEECFEGLCEALMFKHLL